MNRIDELTERLSAALSRIEEGLVRRDELTASEAKKLQRLVTGEQRKTKATVIELEESKVARKRDLADVEDIMGRIREVLEEGSDA